MCNRSPTVGTPLLHRPFDWTEADWTDQQRSNPHLVNYRPALPTEGTDEDSVAPVVANAFGALNSPRKQDFVQRTSRIQLQFLLNNPRLIEGKEWKHLILIVF